MIKIFNETGKFDSEVLKRNPWLKYLLITKNNSVNTERVSSISSITGMETADYVLRTLDILDNDTEICETFTVYDYEIVKKVLQWSEVAKGGTEKQRQEWRKSGYPLEIHNIASAEIYRNESTDDVFKTNLIYTLIKTHGIIGQNIRGEVSVTANNPLCLLNKLIQDTGMKEYHLKGILIILNKCIIGGVSMDLWNDISKNVEDIVNMICSQNLNNFSAIYRMKKLHPALKSSETEKLFATQIFPYFELWYFSFALYPFSEEQIMILMRKILNSENIQKANHISFKPLADSLYYDYEGRKEINVYKLRVIEKYLKTDTIEHVNLELTFENNTISVGVKFSRACEKLIEFCVEAERSGLLTYEKSIKVLFDMFGFRRDEYDRLQNENKYLKTMNDAEESTKTSIVDYVVGNSVADVGSGGGVMLNLLEQKYPNMEIIGTDISVNVLDVLNKKKEQEKHKWNVMQHNFVEKPLNKKVDSIIFSSILHEIFSYTEMNGKKFNLESVTKALTNAYDSLNEGGRIIIRDGVKTDSNGDLTITFKTPEGETFFNNFTKDFAGLSDVSHSSYGYEHTVKGNVNFIREFLYTYTWGNESYSHEVQEQFGYMTLKEFKNFFQNLGANIIECKEFLEDGYYEHLKDLIELKKKHYPASNCIVVIEKPKK